MQTTGHAVHLKSAIIVRTIQPEQKDRRSANRLIPVAIKPRGNKRKRSIGHLYDPEDV